MVKWHAVVSQPFDENTYIVRIDGRQDCLVIDPGFQPEKDLSRDGIDGRRASSDLEYAWTQ